MSFIFYIIPSEHKYDNGENTNNDTTKRIGDNELIKLIDEIMKDEDKNSDGYITYQVFKN